MTPGVALLLPAVLAPASAEPAPREVEVEVVVVEVAGMDARALADELQLRMPRRRIVGVNSPRPPTGFAYVHVSYEPGALRVTLVEPDGRAYDRLLEHEADQEVRVAASVAANLVFAVEGGSIEPDREGATIPEPQREPNPPKPEPPPAPMRPPVVVEPDVQLGVAGTAALGLGLAPSTEAGVFGGGGAALAFVLRHRTGAVVEASGRVLHRRASDLAATRVRVGIGAGYAWRGANLEIVMLGRLNVEPWWLRRDGADAPLAYRGQPTTRRPLLGGGLVLAPGYYRRSPSLPNVAWRFGPRVELGGSFVVHDGVRTARIDSVGSDGMVEPALRLGGLEAEVGFDLAFWFGVGGR